MELGSWWAVGEKQTSLPLRESTASFHSTLRGGEQQISSQDAHTLGWSLKVKVERDQEPEEDL